MEVVLEPELIGARGTLNASGPSCPEAMVSPACPGATGQSITWPSPFASEKDCCALQTFLCGVARPESAGRKRATVPRRDFLEAGPGVAGRHATGVVFFSTATSTGPTARKPVACDTCVSLWPMWGKPRLRSRLKGVAVEPVRVDGVHRQVFHVLCRSGRPAPLELVSGLRILSLQNQEQLAHI